MKARTHIILAASLILIAGLACETGQILTPEEATQRAEATRNPGGQGAGAVSAQYEEGDTVEFVSTDFLVNLYANPGDSSITGTVSRGQTGVVQTSRVEEDALWYFVSTDAGEGWVTAEEVTRGQVEGETEAGDGEIQVGDRVYLTGRGFLVNFYEAAGSIRIVAGQERGALVEVLAIEDVEGTAWYRIEASSGIGWVPADNITTEQPGS